MNLNELDNSSVVEAQLIWARKGTSLTRKYRCVVGKRAGRIVRKSIIDDQESEKEYEFEA